MSFQIVQDESEVRVYIPNMQLPSDVINPFIGVEVRKSRWKGMGRAVCQWFGSCLPTHIRAINQLAAIGILGATAYLHFAFFPYYGIDTFGGAYFDVLVHGVQSKVKQDSSLAFKGIAIALNIANLARYCFRGFSKGTVVPLDLQIADFSLHALNLVNNGMLIWGCQKRKGKENKQV